PPIVHAKDARTALRPKKYDALCLGPQCAPVLAPKVERINVFVFFRRLLGVFDGTVRSFVKPFGMFLDVGMIGRAIECEIERDFHSAFSHLFLEPVEVRKCAERWLDRLVAARFTANCPRYARVTRFADDGVIASFAIRVTDRMNRRKINDIETHRLCVIDPRQTTAKRRATIATTFCRARKKFIPCAE